MIAFIGEFLVKSDEYQRLYKEKKYRKSKACVMNAQLYSLEDREDYEEAKQNMYTKAMDNCDLYMEALKNLKDYENSLTEEEREFVVYAGKNLSSDDIAYFSLQANVGVLVEITKDNIENLVDDIKELGYQSFRYNEALNFVGTKETFEKMFEDFYKDFGKKEKVDDNSGQEG